MEKAISIILFAIACFIVGYIALYEPDQRYSQEESSQMPIKINTLKPNASQKATKPANDYNHEWAKKKGRYICFGAVSLRSRWGEPGQAKPGTYLYEKNGIHSYRSHEGGNYINCKIVGSNIYMSWTNTFKTNDPNRYYKFRKIDNGENVQIIEHDYGSVTQKVYPVSGARQKKVQPKPRIENKVKKTPLPVLRNVRNIQTLLADLGYEPGYADGKLGNKTISAIRLFQSDIGVTADGKVSLELEKSLNYEKSILLDKGKNLVTRVANSKSQENTSSSSFTEDANLIAMLQIYLNTQGLYKGPKNGVMNKDLNHAIQRFQVANRLSVDGQPSQKLLNIVKKKNR